MITPVYVISRDKFWVFYSRKVKIPHKFLNFWTIQNVHADQYIAKQAALLSRAVVGKPASGAICSTAWSILQRQIQAPPAVCQKDGLERFDTIRQFHCKM
jgi:hypothetical protein